MIDLNQFPMHKKPYADNTLRCMPRKELIEYIRDIEHNYETLNWFYQNAVNANLEKFKDFERVVRCKDCKYYQQGSRNSDDWLWCMMNHHYTDEEKYCAWAERKEE